MNIEILIAPMIPRLIMVWVSTAILFLLFKKFFWTKMTTYLNERREYIAKSVEETKQANQEALASKDEAYKVLNEARKEAKTIVEQSKGEAISVKEEIISKANSEASDKLDNAMVEITRQKEKAMQDVQSEVVDIALSAAKEVVKGNIDEAKGAKLVDDFVKDLQA